MNLPLPKEYYKILDIHYKGKKIRTYSFGVGPKKILSLPGFPHSGLIYIYIFLKYDLNKIQVVTMDIPGWIGHSENIYKDSVYDEDETVNVVKKVVEVYNLKEFNLVGYSFGTTLSARILTNPAFKVHKTALISPVLSGKLIKENSKRLLIKIIDSLKLFAFARVYVQGRFMKYAPFLQKEGMDEKILKEYQMMVNSFDAKVVFTSLKHLFESDYSNYLKTIDPTKLLVASSKDESLFLRKQAEHIRKILDGEKTLYLRGNHEDFVLKPSKEVVSAVVHFLTS